MNSGIPDSHRSRHPVDSGLLRMLPLILLSLLVFNQTSSGRTAPENFRLTAFLNAQHRVPSLSRGKASAGSMKGACAMPPKGPGWSLLPMVPQRGTGFAVKGLVDAIRTAAVSVASQRGGAVLEIGNMSRSDGGPIVQSRSHQGGRDIDVAFYFKDRKGRPVRVDGLKSCPDSGRIGRELSFDAEANWLFVKSLLENREPQLQWMFISKGLKELILAEARKRGEPPWLISRAASVLHQPSDSKPHDDHFHIRFYCSLADRKAGCEDYGPLWQWKNDYGSELAAHARDLVAIASRKLPVRERLEALEGLPAVGAHAPVEGLEQLLVDPEAEVARKALEVLLAIKGEDALRGIAATLASRPAQTDLTEVLKALGGWRNRDLFRFYRALIADKKAPRSSRGAALENLGLSGRMKDCELLVEQADEGALTSYALQGLETLAGTSSPPCRTGKSRSRSDRKLLCFRSWCDSVRNKPYRTWVVEHLKDSGCLGSTDYKEPANLKKLLSCTGVKAHSFQAQLLLSKVVGKYLARVLPPNAARAAWSASLKHR